MPPTYGPSPFGASTSGANPSVLAEIIAILRELMRDPSLEVTPQSTQDDVPGWDSMTHIALVVEAECRFGVQFQTGEIETLRSIGELMRAIESKRARAAA